MTTWSVFVKRREECSHEFWEELETRKAAGTSSKDSPFSTMGALARCHHPRGFGGDSNLIKLTREEWEAKTPEDVSSDFILMVIGSFCCPLQKIRHATTTASA